MAKTLKIITLNILNGGRLFDNVLPFLKKENADILVLQEVYNGQKKTLPKRLRSFSILQKEIGYNHAFFAPFLYDISPGINLDAGNGTFSKFPIVSNNSEWFDQPYGPFDIERSTDFRKIPSGFLHTAIQVEGIAIDVFNVHGVWDFLGRDSEKRFKMSDTLIQRIKDKKHVILAGDFNMNPDTKAIANIEKYLTNVFKNELKSTFNMKHKDSPGYATAVVDMIFVSPSIQVLNHNMPDVDVSDHMPLTAKLQI